MFVQVNPLFRRSVNMLMFLVDYATCKSINAFKDSSYNNSKKIDIYNNYKDL
jgi:hypothetical protein